MLSSFRTKNRGSMPALGRRWLPGALVLALCPLLLGGRRLEPGVRGLRLDLAGLLAREAALELPRPLVEQALAIEPARGRLAVLHHGSPLPARAAVRVGSELWLATPAGVLRYGEEQLFRDPSRARPRGRIEALPAPGVHALLADGDRVLVGTDAGLVQLGRDGRTLRRQQLAGERVTALSRGFVGTWSGLHRARSLALLPGSAGLRVTALLEHRGSLLVGTHDRGLLVLAPGGDELRPVAGIPPRARIADLSGGGDRVLAAALDGLYALDARTLRAERIHEDPLHATRVLPRRDGSILVGSFEQGLRALPPGARRTLAHAASGPVSLILEGPGGALLLGDDRALAVIGRDGARRPLPLVGPPPGLVTALALDGDRVHAGSFDGGLGRLEPGAGWQRSELVDPRVTALALVEGRVFVGTASGLLLAPSPGAPPRRVRDPRGWLARHVAALRPVPGGSVLWVAAHPGLVALETAREWPGLEARYFGAAGKEADAGLASPTVYGLAHAEDGIWVATDDGLSRLRLGATRSASDLGGELPESWLNDVRVDDEGTLHVLTLRSGLVQIGRSGTRVLRGKLMTGPGVLLPIATSRGRALLVGSNASGLLVLDASGRARSFSLAQGLPAQTVAALAYDAQHDRLWVGGEAGLTRIDDASRQLGLEARREKERER